MTEPRAAEVLVADRVSKSYGSVPVLRNVDLRLHRGERHAVTGENGAGKSTLIKILGGLVRPDDGAVYDAEGEPITSAVHARHAGVAIVHQHLSLIPTMSVEENCSLSDLPTRLGLVDRRRIRAQAEEALALVDLACDPRRLVSELSFAERQLLEIGRALLIRPRVLILDEPTSALTPSETDRLFRLLMDLNERDGTALIYVSHRITELYELTERATVLRDGELVARLDLSTQGPGELVTAMVGREIDLLTRRTPTAPDDLGPTVLDVRGLCGHGIRSADLQVRRGEVCAIAGLVGAGRTEFVRQIMGLDRPDRGRVVVDGVTLKPGSVAESLRAGIGFVPEDRHRDGIALALSSGDNAVVPSFDVAYRGGWLRRAARSRLVRAVMDDGDVRPRDPSVRAAALSGGNQQKVVIGKWLARDLKVLILDEPTAGVDVEAKSQIHRRISDLAAQGLAVVLVSSDLPEVLTLADRIVVMADGQIVGSIEPGPRWNETAVIELATRQSPTPEAAAS